MSKNTEKTRTLHDLLGKNLNDEKTLELKLLAEKVAKDLDLTINNSKRYKNIEDEKIKEQRLIELGKTLKKRSPPIIKFS